MPGKDCIKKNFLKFSIGRVFRNSENSGISVEIPRKISRKDNMFYGVNASLQS